MASKRLGYRIIVISELTGKELKKPIKGKSRVIYAIRGPRGGVKKLRKEAQVYYPSDFKGLDRSVELSGTNNFVAYEQKTRKPLKVKGVQQYREDKSGVKHKLYETKLTGAKKGRKQKPFLYAKGKIQRALDFGYKKGNYQSVKSMRTLTLVKPNVEIFEQTLKGKTIDDAISNVHVNVNMPTVRKHGFGLYYNIFVLIREPGGNIIKVPVNSSFRDNEFEGTNRIKLKGEFEMFGRSEIKIIANLRRAMSKSIRYALKNTGDGYTFTSLVSLEAIEKRVKKQIGIEEKQGNDALAGKLAEGLKGLYFGWGNKKRYFKNSNTKLTLLDRKKYNVTMYVKFEMMY